MRNIIISLLSIFILASCGTYKPLYHVVINGNADGKVDVTFPDGKFAVDGATNLDFGYGNDSSFVKSANIIPMTLGQAKMSADKNIRKVADFAESYEVSATSTEGHYYLEVDALFREPISGTDIHMHKVLTNRE